MCTYISSVPLLYTRSCTVWHLKALSTTYTWCEDWSPFMVFDMINVETVTWIADTYRYRQMYQSWTIPITYNVVFLLITLPFFLHIILAVWSNGYSFTAAVDLMFCCCCCFNIPGILSTFTHTLYLKGMRVMRTNIFCSHEGWLWKWVCRWSLRNDKSTGMQRR